MSILLIGDIHGCVATLIEHYPMPSVEVAVGNQVFPLTMERIEVHAMAYIIITLKLLFGLDGIHEQ